jgi:Zn-dependent peptidase ImmA (M78 family)
MTDREDIKAVFGLDADLQSLESAVRTSTTQFSRSQYEIEIAEENSKGIKIDARTALRQYGWTVLRQLAEFRSASVIGARGEPYSSIERRLAELGLPLVTVARRAGWVDSDIENFRNRRQIEVRKLDRIGYSLSLPLEQIGRADTQSSDLLVRLKAFRNDQFGDRSEGSEVSLAVAEYSSLLSRFIEIGEEFPDLLSKVQSRNSNLSVEAFVKSVSREAKDDSAGNPVREGQFLARKLRDYLGIESGKPVKGLAKRVEEDLGILLFRRRRSSLVAGLTISVRKKRAIAMDRSKRDSIYLSRSILAHELCHALFDSELELLSVRADASAIFDTSWDTSSNLDYVEVRANAFSAEFLAPADATHNAFENERPSHVALMKIARHFGISLHSAYFQVNAVRKDTIPVEFLVKATRTHAHAFEVNERQYSSWLRYEQTSTDSFFNKVRGVDDARKNRLSLIVLKLHAKGRITADQAISILGYPRISLDTLSRHLSEP